MLFKYRRAEIPLVIWFIPVLIAATQAETWGQQLEYRWNEGQKFSYSVEIVVDTDAEKIAYRGMTHYTVESVNADQSSLTYRGGLSETKRTKQRSVPGRPFGGPFGPRALGGPPGFGRPPSPFSRPRFAGKTQTRNKITLSTRGKILAMEGDSQLPYLIGNVSLLPFEPLPASPQNAWTYDSGISITEEDDSDHPFGPFGPRGRFGPFGQDNSESVQSAEEGGTYKIKGTEGKRVTIAKTYFLNTPKTEDNNVFRMKGQGTWTFDTRDHVPHAYNMDITLTIASGNSTTNIPINVKYSRVSPAELAAMEAKAKREADEAAKLAAEKKVIAETPLTAAEKSKAISSLASGVAADQAETLKQLAQKSLSEPDPEIATAIESLLKSTDSKIAAAADQALRKWSAIYAKRKKLEKEYQGPAPVGSTGLVVESTTPLFVGQLVQAQRPRRGSFWRAARVKELLSDGQVKLAFLTWGKENSRDIVDVQRRNIQLAPPELLQPERKQAAAASPKQVDIRTWKDVTGRFEIEASFIELVDGKVKLRRADGRMVVPLPLEKLSEEDQQFIEKQMNTANPFQLE